MQRPDRHHRADHVGWSGAQRGLVVAQLPSLLRAALVYSGSQPLAETLVEQALSAAARDVPDEDEPHAWLHAHLWARFLDLSGHGGQDPIGPTPGHLPPEDDPGTLRAAVAALPPTARAAVHLVDGEGMSYAQLARVLGTNTQEATAMLHAARRELVPAATVVDVVEGPGRAAVLNRRPRAHGSAPPPPGG